MIIQTDSSDVRAYGLRGLVLEQLGMKERKNKTSVLRERRKWETPLSLSSLDKCDRQYSTAVGIDMQSVGKASLATVFGIHR
jgi:hypothetical protein